MEAFPAGMDSNPIEGPGNSPLKALITQLQIEKPMCNSRATISGNDGIMSWKGHFYAVGGVTFLTLYSSGSIRKAFD